MSIDDVLEKLYDEKIGFSDAKLALLEIIKGVRPEKKICKEAPPSHSSDCDCNNYNGFNQGVDEYEQAIGEVFK